MVTIGTIETIANYKKSNNEKNNNFNSSPFTFRFYSHAVKLHR